MILKNSINNLVKKVTASLDGESEPEEAPSFISIWQTDNAGISNADQIILPLVSAGTYNFDVKYNGLVIKTITNYTDNIITFPDGAGTKEIEIEGEIIGWRFNNGGDRLKLLDVSNWGTFALGPVSEHFRGCGNFNITASDAPDLSFTTSLRESFDGCFSLNTDNIGAWDTSAITNFFKMFWDCTTFNGNVGFDTSSATDMTNMFYNCQQFNQPVSTFDTSNVTSMINMFFNCQQFNQSVSNFNTSNVTIMDGMFRACFVFNQSLSNFDTSNVVNMENMFRQSAFNQSLSNFDTSNVTTMYRMFFATLEFNQSVSNFNTSNVTNMSQMFWTARKFNQPVPFDTSSVTSFSFMFFRANAFNQPLAWNTSSATDMGYMFWQATNFNQDLSSWDFSNVVDCSRMFSSSSLDITNYDPLLISLASQSLQSNVPFHAGTAQYSVGTATTARNTLTGTYLWTITDGGQAP